MSAYRIEITQQDSIDRSAGSDCITNNLFVDLLRISVWGFRLLYRSFFRDRKLVGLTIYSTRRREYNTLHSMFRHQFEQIYQRNQVVAVIQQRLFHRLSHSFARCKMNNCFDTFIFSEHSVKTGIIQAIQFLKYGTDTRYFFDIVYNICAGI